MQIKCRQEGFIFCTKGRQVREKVIGAGHLFPRFCSLWKVGSKSKAATLRRDSLQTFDFYHLVLSGTASSCCFYPHSNLYFATTTTQQQWSPFSTSHLWGFPWWGWSAGGVDEKCWLMVGKKWTSQSGPILSSWLTGGSHDLILLKMDFKILATTIKLDFHSPSKV